MHYQGGKEEEGMKKEETKVMTKMKMKEEEREEMMKDREERKEREEEREEAEIEEALLPDQYSRQTPKCQQPLSLEVAVRVLVLEDALGARWGSGGGDRPVRAFREQRSGSSPGPCAPEDPLRGPQCTEQISRAL